MTWRWFSRRKLELLIEAIENGDTTIRFPVRGTKSVNAMLNRINAMLSRMRRDAAERERYYELIVDSVESGIMVVDAKGYVVRCNDAACRLFGMETVTHLKRLAEFEASLPQKILEAAPGARLISTGVASGRSMSLSLRISNITLRGETLKIVSITNIGSELDDCEIDSWQRLTRVMTHEIMNFAAPIKSLSETLLSLPDKDSETIRAGLSTINEASAQLSRFISSYRRLSTVAVPSPELVEIEPLLRHLSTLSSGFAESRNIKINDKVTPSSLIAYCDRDMTTGILVNLVRNAIEASPEGETVTLDASSDTDGAVTIMVINHGEQIPEEIQRQLFVPFFTTKKSGNGIGLPYSRTLAKAQGATLRLLPYTTQTSPTVFALTFS